MAVFHVLVLSRVHLVYRSIRVLRWPRMRHTVNLEFQKKLAMMMYGASVIFSELYLSRVLIVTK